MRSEHAVKEAEERHAIDSKVLTAIGISTAIWESLLANGASNVPSIVALNSRETVPTSLIASFLFSQIRCSKCCNR